MKDYLKYYGIIYIIFIIAVISAGTMYINDLPFFMRERAGGVQTLSNQDTVDADLPVVKGTLSPPVNVSAYLNPTQEMIDKGKNLYNMNCASCHGNEGRGDGVAGANLNPKPRNFHDLSGWTNGVTLPMLYKTLHEGITNRGMASYSNLPPEDRLNMIMYIRTFAQYPPITQAQIDSIDQTYSLTKGVKQPNQIPVRLAMEKIIKSNETKDARVNNMAGYVIKDRDSGAVIFRNITTDLHKALWALSSDTSWIFNSNYLVNIIGRNTVQNGFKASALYLSAGERDLLTMYLRKLFSVQGK